MSFEFPEHPTTLQVLLLSNESISTYANSTLTRIYRSFRSATSSRTHDALRPW